MVFLLLITVFRVIVGEPTTTKTYEIEIPGSHPIRIVEGEPLWNSRFEHRAFNSKEEEDSLHQFLTNYAEHVYRAKNKQEQDSNNKENPEKQKSWDLVQYPKRNNPFDEKKGWVTLEPVPWSMSKISKWESKYKPNSKPFDDYESQETWNKPENNFGVYSSHKNQKKPPPTPPVAVYNQKVHIDYLGNKYQHKHDHNCQHGSNEYNENYDRKDVYKPSNIYESDEGEIITDGQPSNFPQLYEPNRRRGTEIHPDSHPFSSEGEWVLLSTTKGYKYSPNPKQRSLEINPESIGAHRTVRLTVLPPSKNSKVNMTTSHGGLLQVESTFQTVEQSRKAFNKKQKLKRKTQQKKKRPVRQQALPSTTLTTTRKSSGPDSSAVLAAVGAGMIPATMAMLVPMAMGGRRKRQARATSPIPKTLIIRNMR